MHISTDRSHSFSETPFQCWKYGAGSLAGLMAEYRFTNEGIDSLNGWADQFDDEELTDARRGELMLEFRDIMEDLVADGHAWKQKNDEFRITAKWWLTTTPQS